MTVIRELSCAEEQKIMSMVMRHVTYAGVAMFEDEEAASAMAFHVLGILSHAGYKLVEGRCDVGTSMDAMVMIDPGRFAGRKEP